jgi:serine phosphatase RsbU (regulator of sigma subunit)
MMTGDPQAKDGVGLDSQASLAFLAEASALVARSLDYEQTLAEVARLAVPELADWCAVDVVQPDGSLRQVTSGHPDSELEELLMELRRLYRQEKGSSEGVARVIETGESELATDVRDRPQMEIPADHREVYERLAPRSYMIVPLIARGRTIGALTLLSTQEGRHYGPADLAFAQDLAHRFALAADNARLYLEAEKARERFGFISHATGLLARSLDRDETLRQLAQLAVPRLGDWCSIELIDDNGEIHNAATAHVDPERVKLAERLRTRYPVDPDDPTGVANVVRTGRAELYPEIPDELLVEGAQDDEHLRAIRELGLTSAIIVPLTVRGRALGALTLIHAESGRRYDDGDLQLAQELAGRAAVAVDNASLYTGAHEAVVALQQSLLPRLLPAIPGIEFGARYVPASSELDVGGDWYDGFVLGEGRVSVAIGDVAGHGVEAAAAMGQFRHGLRAYALDGGGPASVVNRLNRLMEITTRREMATLVYGELDQARGVLSFVRAGHPPPLLRDPDGNVTRLEGAGGLPVAVDEEARYEEMEVPFPVGSILFLYTDGLVEGRGELEAGIAHLERLLAEAPERSEELCDQILAGMASDRSRADDIAILSLRRVEVSPTR